MSRLTKATRGCNYLTKLSMSHLPQFSHPEGRNLGRGGELKNSVTVCVSYAHVLSLPFVVSSNNSVILGVNNLNVPRIVAIIAEVCAEDALQDDEQVYMRLLSIARHVQVSVV